MKHEPLFVAVTRPEELRLELCEWLELHGFDPTWVVAVQDGCPTAVQVRDHHRDLPASTRLTRPGDPRHAEGVRIATHWVVVAPRWPLP